MKTTTSYFTYILTCADGTFYIGKTTDIDNRLEQHNGSKKGGAKYTHGRRPVKLAYVEEYETHAEAAKREYELKQLTRKQKEHLIQEKLV